jgi:hypothetical protein
MFAGCTRDQVIFRYESLFIEFRAVIGCFVGVGITIKASRRVYDMVSVKVINKKNVKVVGEGTTVVPHARDWNITVLWIHIRQSPAVYHFDVRGRN